MTSPVESGTPRKMLVEPLCYVKPQDLHRLSPDCRGVCNPVVPLATANEICDRYERQLAEKQAEAHNATLAATQNKELADGYWRALTAERQRAERLKEWISHHKYCEWQEAFVTYEAKPGRRFDPMSGVELHCTCGLDVALAARPEEGR